MCTHVYSLVIRFCFTKHFFVHLHPRVTIAPPHCRHPMYRYEAVGLRGAPMVSDAWSGWLSAYYGGRDVSHHRNIVWSNGALDPWSGQGVYPPVGGGPSGPMVQNISADGSQIALILDLGAHHLDLMFTDPGKTKSSGHS